VKVPEVSGIDLDYRPRDYFWVARLKISLLSGIAGETRRQLVRELVEAGPFPTGLMQQSSTRRCAKMLVGL
jgi:hypothetical protein